MKLILLAGELDGTLRSEMSSISSVRASNACFAVSYAANREEADTLAERADGLIIMGGADVNPALYGCSAHPKTTCSGKDRDNSDRFLLEAFIRANKRVLGICRGCQSMNVFLGSTLTQHVPDFARCIHPANPNGHMVDILPETLLSKLLGNGRIRVNSYHHQAVEIPGKHMKISAYSEDGIVEATEYGRNLLMVQWHPERMYDEMRPLFDWVCGKC